MLRAARVGRCIPRRTLAVMLDPTMTDIRSAPRTGHAATTDIAYATEQSPSPQRELPGDLTYLARGNGADPSVLSRTYDVGPTTTARRLRALKTRIPTFRAYRTAITECGSKY